jgi:hypothetical protein
MDWFPFGAPPIHRELGVVQRSTSGREEVLRALIASLTHHGHPKDNHD